MLAKWCDHAHISCPRENLGDILNSKSSCIASIFLCLSIPTVTGLVHVFFFPPLNFSIMSFTLESYCSHWILSLYIPSTWTLFLWFFSSLILQDSTQMSPPPGSLPRIPVAGLFLLSCVPTAPWAHLWRRTYHRALWALVCFPLSLLTSPQFLQQDWYFYFWIPCAFFSEQHIKTHLLTKWIFHYSFGWLVITRVCSLV